MRTVVFIGLLAIAFALAPEPTWGELTINFLSWVALAAIVMDVVDFFRVKTIRVRD